MCLTPFDMDAWLIQCLGILCYVACIHAVINLGAPNNSRCQIPMIDRLECSEYGAMEHECYSRGCCHDANYIQCYFPASCEKLVSIAGGDSAFLVMPGEDVPGMGAWALMGGGAWCERQYKPVKHSINLELNLEEVRLIYMKLSQVITTPFIFPFNITYLDMYGKWRIHKFHAEQHRLRQTNSMYPQNIWMQFEARRVIIQPVLTGLQECTSFDLISCQAVNKPTPPPPKTTLFPITTPVPTRRVRLRPDPVPFDTRPSAIIVGSFGYILLISLLVIFVIIDLPAYKDNLIYMRRNVHSFIRYHRNKRTLKQMRMNGYARTQSREQLNMSNLAPLAIDETEGSGIESDSKV